MHVLIKSSALRTVCRSNSWLISSKCLHSSHGVRPKTWLMSSQWIRNSFIDYFVSRESHVRVGSSPVVAHNDPSLLFISAGMNQFKPIFLDTLSPTDPMNGYVRCVNSQKCIRVGGKHCDLSAVGTDGRHHTFFEMLGNWSFGDYYKKESCRMAWDLLTEVFKLDVNRLVVTYFGGDKRLGLEPDLETRDIWLQIGLPEDRVIPLGSKENFWEMGETGPCGICTEIHYLLEPTISSNSEHLMRNCIEIWNIVFIQFNKNSNGRLETLHKHFVDTGMGLERIVSVVQNVKSNYETDLFLPYFQCIQNNSHSKPNGHQTDDPLDISYRILADHSRMFTIAISDGLKTGYRGTGFILRKIIRKSIGIAANDFGISSPRQLLTQLSAITVDLLGDAFPELILNQKTVGEVLNEEIEKYESVVSDNKRLVKAFTRIDIKTKGDPNMAFKIGLDHLGHKPTALFHTSANGKEFYIQTTVPNKYQKFLKANEWLSHISDKLQTFQLLSNKRKDKMSSLKCTSMDQMDEAITCAKHIADQYFKHN
ncbi:unnamed protein product [Oppiella nova]|uniref:alanine--tRNA ligase n=1 Tax=Oppiella nova TaxID=334625 RepID=A0A7R9QUS6_9ACAR|nr:unnamed protein product [Oppiella nova]CAG2174797.1 unnamed protein product [Oppiella nova]